MSSTPCSTGATQLLTPRVGPVQFLVAVALADDPLPPAPPRCRWVTHGGIAGLTCDGAPGPEGVYGRTPRITPLAPQPVCAGRTEVARLLALNATPLRSVLRLRQHCAEYRIAVVGGAEQADMRFCARLAQDFAALARAVGVTRAGLLPDVSGTLLIALSLVLPDSRMPALLDLLDASQPIAAAHGLTLHMVGPDALRSFPVALSGRAEPAVERYGT